jgi:hypothetical protein
MAEAKTKKNSASVENFLSSIEDERRRDDCFEIAKIMSTITKSEPAMWGNAIVGFGSYEYVYASGQKGDWPLVAFSPRKQDLTLYLMPVFDKYPDKMKKLGKCKTSKGCLYIKSLGDIDLPTLKWLIKTSTQDIKKRAAEKKVVNRKK